jgi:DNA-binding SARP family transcriptional activator
LRQTSWRQILGRPVKSRSEAGHIARFPPGMAGAPHHGPAGMLRLSTFGRLSIESESGAALTGAATQRRPLALLVFVAACQRGRSRDKLLLHLWPESTSERGRNVLKQTLYVLRRDLSTPDLFLGENDLQLNPAVISSDIADFEGALERGDLARAIELYRGPFLHGFHLRESPEFERWRDREAVRLASRFASAVRSLAQQATDAHDHQRAIELWRRLATAEPLDADAALGLIKALIAAGDRAGALQHGRVYEASFDEETGGKPDVSVMEALERIRSPAYRTTAPQGMASPGVVPSIRELPAPAAGSQGDTKPEATARMARWSRNGPWVLAAALVLSLVLAGLIRSAQSRRDRSDLDSNLVVVAPYGVFDPELELWREGLVDVLSRSLDGAGPIRTVAPSVAIRRWRGRPDTKSAAELGRRTGAALAISGSLVQAGRDSIRVTSTLVDVATEKVLGEIEHEGSAAHMDQLTDSLAIGLLRELGRTRPIGAVRRPGLGARSVPVLKAFLRAEQYYRRGVWDSARQSAEEAVGLDTAFSLGYERLAQAIGWQTNWTDSLANVYRLRAGALNRRLAPRDSLLVLADSLFGALEAGTYDAASPARGARLFRTLEEAVRRYPEDPEAWCALGEARYHLGVWLVPTDGWRATLAAFERSIALDSLFAPAYFHPVELSYALGDTAHARRFATTAIRLNPQSAQARGLRALQRLLAMPDSAGLGRVLDTLPADLVKEAYATIARWPDQGELAVRILRYWVSSQGTKTVPSERLLLVRALAFRGHVREALAMDDSLAPVVFAEGAQLGYLSAERAAATFNAWLRKRPLDWSALALPWWGESHDSASIRRFMARLRGESRAQRSRGEPALDDSVRAAQLMALAQAHLALSREDTAAGLRSYEPLLGDPASCHPWWCQTAQLGAVRLLVRRGRLGQAARILNTPPTIEGDVLPRPSDLLWYLERGRVAERLHDYDRAIQAFRYVAAAWRHPDSELEPYAAEARAALDRLVRPKG